MPSLRIATGSPLSQAPVILFLGLLATLGPATAMGQPAETLYPTGVAAGDLTLEDATFTAAGGTVVHGQTGRLVVPENRASAHPNLIELAFVRLRTTADDPRPPLIYLAGGPGGSSTWMAEDSRSLRDWLPVLAFCDVILLDQRATGESQPKLVWRPETYEPFPDLFLDRRTAIEHLLPMARRAAEHFRAAGVDFDGYTSEASAEDIDALRQALGLEKVSLMGFSYGTHLALATMRRHGSHLENVIAVGVEPLDCTHKLPLNADTQVGKLALLIQNDDQIGPRFGDLREVLRRILDRLDREPLQVPIYDRDAGRVVQATVGREGLLMILRFDLGDASDLPVFPRLLHDIEQGDLSSLAWFVQKRWRMANGINLMGMLMDGSSGASAERWNMITAQAKRSLFGNVVNFYWPEIDEATGVHVLGEDYRAPLVSDVRTLLLTGSLDYNAPPYQAEQVRWGLPNATHISVENAGHEQIIPNPQVGRIMVRFLSGEDVHDGTVVAPPLRFVPLEGYDPEVTHPSVEPAQGFAFAFITQGIEGVRQRYDAFKARYPQVDTESGVNDLGYTLLRAHLVDPAIAVLKLNTRDYPDRFNTWDSLAEAYKEKGDVETATQMYEKSLELNPDNQNAKKMLAELASR